MMRWVNPGYVKCPKCNEDFVRGMKTDIMHAGGVTIAVIKHKCGFAIRETRYKEIVQRIMLNNYKLDEKDIS